MSDFNHREGYEQDKDTNNYRSCCIVVILTRGQHDKVIILIQVKSLSGNLMQEDQIFMLLKMCIEYGGWLRAFASKLVMTWRSMLYINHNCLFSVDHSHGISVPSRMRSVPSEKGYNGFVRNSLWQKT